MHLGLPYLVYINIVNPNSFAYGKIYVKLYNSGAANVNFFNHIRKKAQQAGVGVVPRLQSHGSALLSSKTIGEKKLNKRRKAMKRFLVLAGLIIALLASAAIAQDIKGAVTGALKSAGGGSSAGGVEVAAGLKEALATGTGNAVQSLSKADGYFGDAAVKILMPGKMQHAAELLKKAGYQKEVDDFTLSMNRAAEQAAPKARPIFEDAVKNMSFEDAQKILNGGNTAATDYFKAKTSPQLTQAFKPVIADSMNQAGVTHSYKALTDRYTSMVPFGKMDSLDLDSYVTQKSMDGLFLKVGQEEAKIRTNPAARTTDLLKKVFAK